MNQASLARSAEAPPGSAAVAPPASGAPASETVTRPDPGLARGKWEAPVWAFGVALAVLVVGTALYVLGRLGYLTRRKAGARRGRGS